MNLANIKFLIGIIIFVLWFLMMFYFISEKNYIIENVCYDYCLNKEREKWLKITNLTIL